MSSIEKRSLLVKTLGRVYSGKARTLSDVPNLLKQLLAEDAWRDFVTEMGEHVTYEADEFRDFLCTPPLRGLGGTEDAFLAVLRAAGAGELVTQVVTLLTKTPLGRVGHPLASNVSDTNIGPAAASDVPYVVRRLNRDAPEIAAQVAAGTVSPNKAAVMAGIRHGYLRVRTDDVDRAVSKLIEFYTPDEIRGALKRAGR